MSDSHDHIPHIIRSVEVFKNRNADYVLHLGDFVNPNSVRACEGIKLIGIFGNNDGDRFRLMHAFNDIHGEIKGDYYEFEEDNVRFACYHGTELQIKNALVECGKYDVVLYGHTHKSEHIKRGNTLVLNPGTTHGFEYKPTIMIFDTRTKQAELIAL